jgi:phospholipase/carboxylesterase
MHNTIHPSLSRREFVASLGAVSAAVFLPAAPQEQNARLTARPGKPTETWQPGRTALWENRPGAFLHIPKSYDPAKPIALMVALHGAGGRSNGPLRTWTPQADARNFVLVVPESSSTTWDAIRGLYGDDVEAIDRALKLAFARVNVDPRRVALQGFSDGASYGIGLALNNTDLFTHVIASSPGFITRYGRRRPGAKPAVFVSHGRGDPILPYSNAAGRIVPQLQGEGCAVTFRAFEGGHAVPVDVADEAAKWLMRA